MHAWSAPSLVEPVVEGVYVTLWLGALMLAGNREFEPFPDEFGELAVAFFAACAPVAKA